jgi:hypothetical protein
MLPPRSRTGTEHRSAMGSSGACRKDSTRQNHSVYKPLLFSTVGWSRSTIRFLISTTYLHLGLGVNINKLIEKLAKRDP